MLNFACVKRFGVAGIRYALQTSKRIVAEPQRLEDSIRNPNADFRDDADLHRTPIAFAGVASVFPAKTTGSVTD